MFQDLDPRVRLLWWLSISILAMVLDTAKATIILIFALYLSWRWADMVRQLVRFTLGLIPFLVVITIVSLFPTFDLERGLQMALRYYVLVGSTILVMNTTSYGELTTAFRNLRHPRIRFLEKPIEVFSLVFSLAFLTVPVAAEEWASLKEAQRARGVDLSVGNRLIQARRGLAMLQPLVLRILERIKNFGIAIVMYGYNPFETRTLFRPLKFSRVDKKIASTITVVTVIGAILAFMLKV